MPQVRFGLLAGLADSIGRHGPEFVSSSVNWFAHSSTLKKRLGSTVFRAAPAQAYTTTAAYAAWSDGTEPATVYDDASVPIPGDTGNDTVFIGSRVTFNRFKIDGIGTRDTAARYDLTRLTTHPLTQGCEFYYWNGTAWTQCYPGNAARWTYNTANDTSYIAPWLNFSGTHGGTAGSDTTQLECMMEPPSDWTSKDIGGADLYWIKIVLPVNTASGPENISSFSVCATENRVLNLLTWQDRMGTPHDLCISMDGDDGKLLTFMLDGVTLTQSVDLQPDGNSAMYSAETKIITAYHGATDRVIGYIQNAGWFYLIPGDGNVYSLPADSVGTNTPYQSVFGGLRSGLPEAEHMIVSDSRLFSATDQTVSWSSPGAYIDVWPNRNQIYIDDGLGPITGMAVVQGSLIIFKRRAIYAVQANGQNDGDGYDALPLSNNVGAIGGLCGAGDQLFFVGEDGFYRFDGKQAVRLNNKIDPEFLSGEIGMDFRRTKSVFYSPLGQVRFFFPFESANVLDRAAYIDAAAAVTPGEEEDSAFGVWPQGRTTDVQPGQYGFQGTAVCADYTQARPRILMGDRYGFVWEMDSGYADAGYQVVADVLQSEQNFAGSNVVLAGPTFLSQNGQMTTTPVEVTLVPNGQPGEGKSINANPYSNGMSRAWTVYANAHATNKMSEAGVTKRLNHNVRCHSFAVRLVDDVAGAREVTGVSVGVISYGDRGV